MAGQVEHPVVCPTVRVLDMDMDIIRNYILLFFFEGVDVIRNKRVDAGFD